MMLVFRALELSVGSVLQTADVRQLDGLRGDDIYGSATEFAASELGDAQRRTVGPDRNPVLRGTLRLFVSRHDHPGDGGVERQQSGFQCGRRWGIFLLCIERIRSDVQLRGRVSGWRLRRRLQAVRLGSADENLSRSLLDAADSA